MVGRFAFRLAPSGLRRRRSSAICGAIVCQPSVSGTGPVGGLVLRHCSNWVVSSSNALARAVDRSRTNFGCQTTEVDGVSILFPFAAAQPDIMADLQAVLPT